MALSLRGQRATLDRVTRRTRSRPPAAALLLAALLLPAAACAAPPRPFDANHPAIIEPLPQGAVEEPISVSQGVVLVQTRIDGRGPFVFALDSGSTTVVLDEDAADVLGAKVERRTGTIVTEAGRSDGTIRQTTLSDVRVGGARFRRVGALVMDLAPLSRGVGRRLDGILGAPLLARHVWTIDASRSVIRIEDSALPEPDGADVLALDAAEDLPAVEVTVAGERLLAIVDTGQRMALALAPEHASSLGPRLRVVGTSVGHVLDGEVKRDVARLAGTVRIGAIVLREPPVLLGQATRLGLDAFRGRSIAFDLANRRMRVAEE